MKVTIYTISTCPFCKQEKEYLKKNNTQFEEKNLEQNKEWLTEMLERSDNFSGVPFTVIEKDGGEVKLKGFTKEEFDKALSLAEALEEKPAEEKPAAASTPPPPPTEAAKAEEPAKAPSEEKPEPVEAPAGKEPTAQAPQPIAAEEKSEPELDEKLKGVLSNLQSMSAAEKPVDTPAIKTPPTETGAAEQPEQVKQEETGETSSTGDLPSIPDFPKKE